MLVHPGPSQFISNQQIDISLEAAQEWQHDDVTIIALVKVHTAEPCTEEPGVQVRSQDDDFESATWLMHEASGRIHHAEGESPASLELRSAPMHQVYTGMNDVCNEAEGNAVHAILAQLRGRQVPLRVPHDQHIGCGVPFCGCYWHACHEPCVGCVSTSVAGHLNIAGCRPQCHFDLCMTRDMENADRTIAIGL